MVHFCCVVGCVNRSNRERNKKFYRLPNVNTRRGPLQQETSLKRRVKWLINIARQDLKDSYYPGYLRVCSDHFHNGKPSDLMDTTHPDWAPTLKMGYDLAGILSSYRKPPDDHTYPVLEEFIGEIQFKNPVQALPAHSTAKSTKKNLSLPNDITDNAAPQTEYQEVIIKNEPDDETNCDFNDPLLHSQRTNEMLPVGQNILNVRQDNLFQLDKEKISHLEKKNTELEQQLKESKKLYRLAQLKIKRLGRRNKDLKQQLKESKGKAFSLQQLIFSDSNFS